MIQGVLFDFNGTLFQDTAENKESWGDFARIYGQRELSEEDFNKHVNGVQNELVISYLLDRTVSKEEVADFSDKKESIYRQLCLQHQDSFHLTTGAPALLSALKQQKIPINVASAAGKDNFEFYFEHFKLDQWFDFDRIVYDDGTIKSKPDPAPYLLAAQRLGLKAADCIIFEDSKAGIQAANAAGSKKIIAIATNANHEQLKLMDNVVKVIDDFTQVSVAELR